MEEVADETEVLRYQLRGEQTKGNVEERYNSGYLDLAFSGRREGRRPSITVADKSVPRAPSPHKETARWQMYVQQAVSVHTYGTGIAATRAKHDYKSGAALGVGIARGYKARLAEARCRWRD